MNSVTINKNSWLYKFTGFAFPTRATWDTPDDICEYRLRIIWAFVRLILASAIAFSFGYTLPTFITETYPCWGTSKWDIFSCTPGIYSIKAKIFFIYVSVIMTLCFSIGIVMFSVGVAWVICKFNDYFRRKVREQEEVHESSDERPSVVMETLQEIRNVYRSWKDKVCYKVEVK